MTKHGPSPLSEPRFRCEKATDLDQYMRAYDLVGKQTAGAHVGKVVASLAVRAVRVEDHSMQGCEWCAQLIGELP